MRLWSLHPRHLDRQGLVAAWREGLLAQAVLAGRTKGYRHHSQLQRFRDTDDPLATIGAFLQSLQHEATQRGYRFDRTKIISADPAPTVDVTDGQVSLEWQHLMAKLDVRSPEVAAQNRRGAASVHPLFRVVPGPVASWEQATGTDGR